MSPETTCILIVRKLKRLITSKGEEKKGEKKEKYLN